MNADAELPWRSYSKSKLPRGYSWVVGRDAVERSLRDAGAVLDALSFGDAWPARPQPVSMVFDVYWVGDGGSHIFDPDGTRSGGRLLMRWAGLPNSLKAEIAGPVLDTFLPQACEWAASAPNNGNAWTSADHRWMLHYVESDLRVTHDLLR